MNVQPRHIFLAPLAIFLAIRVGIPVSRARNEAAYPLLSECPNVLWILLMGGNSLNFSEGLILCGVGAIVFIAIPGAITIGLIAYEV